MGRTFITQVNPNLDYSAAGDDQVVVFPMRLQIIHDDAASEAVEIARTTLITFDPEKDRMVLGGDPILIAICIGILATRVRGEIELLKFDKRSRTYTPVLVEF